MRITHIITGLGQGGAESTLFRLCKACPEDIHTVVSMREEGVFSERLRSFGIEVYHLNIDSGLDAVLALPKLTYFLARQAPDVIQTWMYHANLFGGVAARLAGIRNVHWGLRHGVVDDAVTKNETLRVIHLSARLSKILPKSIVSCSTVGADNHVEIGYAADRMIIIPNGLELGEFTPHLRRTPLSDICGAAINPDLPILGMVARYNPYKDYSNLIEALGILLDKGLAFHCLLAGEGISEYNTELVSALDSRNILSRVSLLGRRDDVPIVMNALDLSVLSSRGEAFPNVIAEAMACGIPCVTTDVGDAAFIVGDTGWVVPSQSPQDLAKALERALLERENDPLSWNQRKLSCRERVQQEFSMERMVLAYRSLWSNGVN